MNLLPIRKILRLALAISVSLWMAGAGCLLGCSNETHASPSGPIDPVETVVAEDSCASSSHDCCARKKAQATTPADSPDHDVINASQVRPTRSSTMESCPMAVSASAIVSKARPETSKACVARTIEAPLPSTTVVSNLRATERLSLYNRGPTYLRCCVFLL
ncbi:MAG TPA: hypothetical protein VLA93_21370 [Pyrinomonadaceae bacterium]|nr:hypothetical protein [Pyrinomonadaceae bacterium]